GAPGPGRLAPFEGLARSDLFRQVQPDQPRKRLGVLQQRLLFGDAVADGAMRHAFFADQRRQRAGIDTRQRTTGVVVSRSSSLAPTMPICGKVKATICPA